MSAAADPQHRIAVSILLIGAALRLWGFFTAGPLWLDELFIAANLRLLSYADLLGPLLHDQNAPVGWLLLEKALWDLGDADELSLRLPALIASLIALPLTWALARRALGGAAALLALLFVAISPFAVWQSFQVKPYGCDLFAATLLLWLALRLHDQEAEHPEAGGRRSGGSLGGRTATLILSGAVLVWFSLPAIFVLAGVGTWLLAAARRRPGLRTASLAAAAWPASFGAHYLLFQLPRPQAEWQFEYWSSGLLAWPPAEWDVFWLPRVLSSAMEDPLALVGWGPLAALVSILGAASFVGRGASPARRLVASPIPFALLASALRLYPFSSRLVLFLLPSLAMLFVHGLATLCRWAGRRLDRRAEVMGRAPALFPVVAGAALAVPALLTTGWLPRGGLPIAAESEQLFLELSHRHRAGEPVVLGHLATYAWREYGPRLDGEIVETPPAWLDRDRVAALRRTLDTLDPEAATVWVVLTRVKERVAPRWSYAAFVDDRTTWPPVELFREEIEDDWRIAAETRVYGGYLWRLVRSAP